MEPNQEKKAGPIIAILVIVLILIIAALYLFASRINEETLPLEEDIAPTTSVAPITGTSDEVQDLERDLESATAGLEEQNF